MTRLYRSERDKKLFGICGGLGEIWNVDSNLLRLVVVVTTLFSAGTVIPLYLLAALVIPTESNLERQMQSASSSSFDTFHSSRDWHRQSPPPGTPFQPEPAQSQQPDLDELMKDVEKKALWKEIEELKAKLAKYEKGDAS